MRYINSFRLQIIFARGNLIVGVLTAQITATKIFFWDKNELAVGTLKKLTILKGQDGLAIAKIANRALMIKSFLKTHRTIFPI